MEKGENDIGNSSEEINDDQTTPAQDDEKEQAVIINDHSRDEQISNEKLPITATPIYRIIWIGCSLFIFGGAILIFKRRFGFKV